ncbi:MAG: nucleotidyl transferase AbiEii/AbiGii toxin family protein [Bacteroidota bacterium]|nr:nucleotidyl transferase AbiEii/AbiGii toxin family protein [Bacteroidota bacterium]
MFQTLLIKLAKAFDSQQIPYIVIGGQAVLLYGEPRLTRDIDITLGIDNSTAAQIVDLAKTIQLYPAVDDVDRFVKKSNVLPLYDHVTKIRVDLIFSFLDYEQQAMGRANPVLIEDYPVKYASLEDVIIHKVFAGRPRDVEDVKSILQRNPSFDRSFIELWLHELSKSVDKNLVKDFHSILPSGK